MKKKTKKITRKKKECCGIYAGQDCAPMHESPMGCIYHPDNKKVKKEKTKKIIGDYLFTPNDLNKLENEINAFDKKIKNDISLEVWKDINGYEKLYQVSNLGRIKSLGNDKYRKEKILKLTIIPNGYLTVGLCKKTFHVHLLVANIHLKKPKIKNIQVNHINGIKTDNRVNNLEWVTASDNRKHAFIIGLQNKPNGEINPMCKFTDNDVKNMRKLYLKGTDRKIISKKYNISLPRLCDILNYKCRV